MTEKGEKEVLPTKEGVKTVKIPLAIGRILG